MEDQARTIKNKETFLKVFGDNLGIMTTSCKVVGIDRQTYYNWLESDVEFKEKVEKIKYQQRELVECKLLTAINDGNITGVIFYLKNRHPDYLNTLKLGGELKNSHTFELSKEEQDKIINILQTCAGITIKRDNKESGEKEVGN